MHASFPKLVHIQLQKDCIPTKQHSSFSNKLNECLRFGFLPVNKI